MKEKKIQDFYTEILTAKGIQFLHIPNSTFKGKYQHPSLKHQPDLFFQYKGTLYLREVGIPNVHIDRKSKQMDKMKKWAANGADIAIILSMEAAREDCKYIGLIETLSK